MQDPSLPKTLQDFLSQQISSVVQVELLLLLHADAPRPWTAEELARELRIDATWAATQADDLCNRGVLACDRQPVARYHFNTADIALHQIVSQLAEAYADRRVSIISFIYSKPIDRIKTFADAFRLRKEKRDG